MAMKGDSISTEKNTVTIVGGILYMNEKIMTQFGGRKIGKTVKMFIVEVDQQKY